MNDEEADKLIDDVAYGLIDGRLSSITIAHKVAQLREYIGDLKRAAANSQGSTESKKVSANTLVSLISPIAAARRNARVFWLDTQGGEPGDGAWYWVAQNETCEDLEGAEPVGPFETAVEAGRDARHWIVYWQAPSCT